MYDTFDVVVAVVLTIGGAVAFGLWQHSVAAGVVAFTVLLILERIEGSLDDR